MKRALLRGLLVGAGVGAVAFAVVQTVVLLDGGKFAEILDVACAQAICWGLCAAGFGYVSHPSAKKMDDLPGWVDRWGTRVLIGFATGCIGAMVLLGLAAMVGFAMGEPRRPLGLSPRQAEIETVLRAVLPSMIAGLFAAAMVGIFLTPASAPVSSLWRCSSLAAFLGTIASGWIGTAIGLLAVYLERRHAAHLDGLAVVAFYLGGCAGIAAAVLGRFRRR